MFVEAFGIAGSQGIGLNPASRLLVSNENLRPLIKVRLISRHPSLTGTFEQVSVTSLVIEMTEWPSLGAPLVFAPLGAVALGAVDAGVAVQGVVAAAAVQGVVARAAVNRVVAVPPLEEVAQAVLWLASDDASFVTATDLEVDERALRRQIDYVVEDCSATMVVAAGVETQEYTYLSLEGRKALISRTIELVDGRVPVMVGVSHPSFKTAI